MRKWIGSAAMFLAASMTHAGNVNSEAIMKEFLKNSQEAIDLLGTIKDDKTAAAARVKLRDLSKRLTEFQTKFGAIDKKKMEVLNDKYKKQIMTLDAAVNEEFLRLEKLPASWEAFENTLFATLILGRREEARSHVQQLTEAVQTYKINYKEYPPQLNALAQKKPGGGEPLVDEKALLDPWGRPYEYDIKGPRNQGKIPDLWSHGPLLNNAASIIGNWQDAAKKNEPKK